MKNGPDYLNFPDDKEDFQWGRKNNYHPGQHLQNISVPVLSLFAEFDVLVPPAENAGFMKTYLEKAGVNYLIKIIDGAAHDMKTLHGLNGDNWNFPKYFLAMEKTTSDVYRINY